MNEKLTANDLINTIPLDQDTTELAQQIIEEKNLDSLQNLTHLFNLNQAKKNVLRVMKLNQLLDKVSDQMIERFDKTPDNFSNADLLNYMQVTQSAIDRANKSLNLVDETPAIQVNTQINVNVNADGLDLLDRESKGRVAEAIKGILNKIQSMNNTDLNDIIEVKEEPINLIEDEDKNKEEFVKETVLLNEEEY
jgi:hypothetical protein